VRTMAEGMSRYAGRAAERDAGACYLDDDRELSDYCWVVAGCVGEMLTRLFELRLPASDPARARRHALAPVVGEALQLTNILLDLPNDLRCITSGVPKLGGNAASYNSYYQIVQSSESVAILMEMMHDARIVPLDGREQLPPTIQQRLGSSRGHWEGDTLVVETANFKDNARAGLGGRGTGATTHLTERFTRVSATSLKYEVTVNDPWRYTKPWTAVLYWKAEQKDQVYEYACHEGNEAMAGTLRGYRAQEKAAADAARKGSR